MYYVYVLKSQKDSNYYIGQTNNLDSRLKRHNAGYIKSTKNRRPLKLIFHKSINSRSEAMKYERYLKSGAGREFLDNILDP